MGVILWGYTGVILPTIMENQMEKRIKHNMETRVLQGFYGGYTGIS